MTTTPTPKNIGLIGTGTMGAPMALRLMEAGHVVFVHDRTRSAASALLERGAVWADSPADVASQVEVVLTSLPGPPLVEEVVTGLEGILAGAHTGLVHADLSTSSVASARRLFELEKSSGVAFLDAPVSGGAGAILAGNLTVMASGDRAAFERVRSILGCFSKDIFYLGAPGSGTMAKLANNAILLASAAVLQEVLVTAAKCGLESDALFDVLRASSSNMYLAMAPLYLSHAFDDAFFALALATKDLSLFCDSAEELGVPTPASKGACDLYRNACEAGLGSKVFFATLALLEEQAGVVVEPPSASG